MMFARLESQKDYINTNQNYFSNPYFNHLGHQGQQNLHDLLVQEQIQTTGVEFIYLEREYQKLDRLFGEDPQNYFHKAKKFIAYLESFDGYQGQNEIFSKFGMSVNDEISLQINPNLFKQQTGILPKEGDLIFFPLGNQFFEITWTTPREQFYQLGKLPITKITAQKWIYSHEKIDPRLHNTEIQQDLYDINTDELTQLETEDLEQLFGISEKLEKTKDVYKEQYQEDIQINKQFSEVNIDTSPVNGMTNTQQNIIEFLE